jgi:hypothetical protein
MALWMRELNGKVMNQPIETEGTNVSSDSPKTGRSRYRYRTAAMVAIVLVAVLASAVSAYSTNSAPLAASKLGNMQNLNATISQTIGGSVTVSIGSSSQSHQAITQTAAQMTTQTTPMTSTSEVMTSTMQTQTSSIVSQAQAATTSVMQTVATTTVVPQDCGTYGCYPYPSYPYAPYPLYSPGYPAYPDYYPAYSNGYGGCSYAISTSPNNNAVQCYGYVFQAPNGCVELEVAAVNAPYYGGTALQYYTLHNLSSTPPTGTWVRVQGLMYQGYNTSPTGAGCPGNYINVSSMTTL